jgi:hypothetical protein
LPRPGLNPQPLDPVASTLTTTELSIVALTIYSYTQFLLCVFACATRWITQVHIRFLWSKYSLYIFIVRDFMNQILDKLETQARIIRKLNNPLLDNWEYTVMWLSDWYGTWCVNMSRKFFRAWRETLQCNNEYNFAVHIETVRRSSVSRI